MRQRRDARQNVVSSIAGKVFVGGWFPFSSTQLLRYAPHERNTYPVHSYNGCNTWSYHYCIIIIERAVVLNRLISHAQRNSHVRS